MPRVPFDTLPDTARLWLFAAERPLRAEERSALLATVDAFIDTWQAHGHPLTAGRDLRDDQFLQIAVDERAAGVSGCSIDALTRSIHALERQLGVILIDHGPVLFREHGRVRRVPRDEFAELARRGEVTPDTVVFDNTISELGALRAGRWQVPAAESWHGRAFF